MTISPEAEFLGKLYGGWSQYMADRPDMGLDEMRNLFEGWQLATREPEGVSYKSESLAGVDALWAIPDGCKASKVILYAHGGGFVVGSTASHRKLLGHLAQRLRISAVALDYRRAPEHKFPAQINDMVAAYKELRRRNYRAADIVIAGDSAGGNLAIASVLALRDADGEMPEAVIVFSPWLDMEHVGRTLDTNDAVDVLVKKPVLQGMSASYLNGEGDRTNPLANPLKADFAGFPRTYIAVGSLETLLDNATDLAEIARCAGVNVTLSIVEGMQHVFPFLAGRATEADDELRRIGAWFKAA